jgi:hypothetical protein
MKELYDLLRTSPVLGMIAPPRRAGIGKYFEKVNIAGKIKGGFKYFYRCR